MFVVIANGDRKGNWGRVFYFEHVDVIEGLGVKGLSALSRVGRTNFARSDVGEMRLNGFYPDFFRFSAFDHIYAGTDALSLMDRIEGIPELADVWAFVQGRV